MEVQALVHGPVELQARLAAVQHAVGIAALLSVRQHMVPHAHLGDVALEALSGREAVGTAHGEGSKEIKFGGGQCLDLAAIHLELQVVARPADRQQGVFIRGDCHVSVGGCAITKATIDIF